MFLGFGIRMCRRGMGVLHTYIHTVDGFIALSLRHRVHTIRMWGYVHIYTCINKLIHTFLIRIYLHLSQTHAFTAYAITPCPHVCIYIINTTARIYVVSTRTQLPLCV